MTLRIGMARICAALCALAALGVLVSPRDATAQNGPNQVAAAGRDGARDFDWEIGTWQTVVRVRAPFSTADDWVEFRGTSVVHAFSDGRANLVVLDVADGARRIEGVSLRLYNPQTRQWSVNFASMRDGALTAPLFGGFDDGQGVFYGQDTHEGRVVLVRFVMSQITADSARFVQSYSADGGQSWTDNWIAVDTRRRD